MRARKVDANQKALRDAWLAMGGSWLVICPEQGGEPDALVGFQGMDQLVEIKLPLGKKGGTAHSKVSPDQAKWHASWKGRPVVTVRTLTDLLIAFGREWL